MKKSCVFVLFGLVYSAALLLPGRTTASEPEVPNLGDRLELFVDAHRIEKMNGVSLNLHSPKRMGSALKFDKPWEGLGSAYVTVFQDGDLYRMYYRGWADLSDYAVHRPIVSRTW